MKPTWRTDWLQWLLLAGMFVLALASWNRVPDSLPVHWNLRGEVDRMGGKFEGLLAVPLTTLGLYVLFLLLPRIDPGRENYARFLGTYHAFRNVFVAFMAALYGVMHLSFRGHALEMGTFTMPALGVLFIFVGNLLGKLRPNWFMGIRTPWTLTSKQSWVRSHRVGGWIFILGGLAFLIAGLLRRPWLSTAAMVLFGAGLAGLVVYSWWVWKHDPDKVPPAGTRPA